MKSRILVSDDDNITAHLIISTLEKEGFQVLRAMDGEQCLQLAHAEVPELIVLDLMIPKMHGLEVLKALRADPATSSIGVIVCSAKDYKTEMAQARELGTFDFMSKPIPTTELLAMVKRYFADASAYGESAMSTTTSSVITEEEVFRPRQRTDNGSFRLWGTRGSIPVSGPQYSRHGGNTSCMEIVCGDDRIIFDAGSGVRELGLSLMADPPRKIHLFITHTHWDHIQGFPFFAPTFVPGFEIDVYAPPNVDKDIESIFRGQLDRAYFPIQMEDMQAKFKFKILGEEVVKIGDVRVEWEYTLHPGATVGYKVDIRGKSLAYIPDNEFLKGYLGPPDRAPGQDAGSVHAQTIDFLKGVNVLIHEAQYTAEEYADHIGWGHSSVPNVCVLAKSAEVGKWIAIHHDPTHSDDFLQNKLNLTRQILRDLGSSIVVEHGYDGMMDYL
ncbi:MAG: response regulator [Candidatus Latescibacterota bacterium]|nr:response regulator [Candidatus Latescibacterota bacterium]